MSSKSIDTARRWEKLTLQEQASFGQLCQFILKLRREGKLRGRS